MNPHPNHLGHALDRRLLLRGGLGLLGACVANGGVRAFAQESSSPLAAKAPHFAARAKRVIFLNMRGAPSHVDTFDHKPELTRATGKQGKFRGTLMGSPWAFRQHGASGLWISDLFPELAKQADSLCLLNGMHCDQPNHPQAQTQLHTGTFQFVRPSLGAWILYGIGTENDSLPGFVTIAPNGSAQNYGSAYLPAVYQGTKLDGRQARGIGRRRRGTDAGALPDIANDTLTAEEQRAQLDFIQGLNERALRRERRHPGIEGVMESFELAYRMQSALPAVMSLDSESDAVLERYGVGGESSDAFGRQCLVARRLSEAGVRFVEVTHGNWDHHRNLDQALSQTCAETDRPIAGLIQDLAERDLLDETLVLWAGEFGRTPHSQNGNGRDHNHKGFSAWLAGGGVQGGLRYGATDELGYEAVSGKLHVHDWHATILHLLGLDHERLTFNYAGRDFRLTDVHGHVAEGILA